MSKTILGLIGTVLWASIILHVLPLLKPKPIFNVTVETINNVMWCYLYWFESVWHVEIQFNHHESHFYCQSCVSPFFAWTRVLCQRYGEEDQSGQVYCGYNQEVGGYRWGKQSKRMSFQAFCSWQNNHYSPNPIREAGYCCSGHPFHQFHSSTTCPPQNSQKGTSEEWFQVCYKEESAHVKEDSLSEAAGVCTMTWKLVIRRLEKNLVDRWN